MEIQPGKGNELEYEVLPLAEFVGVKSYRAKGKRLTNKNLKKVTLVDPLPEPVQEEEVLETEPEKDAPSEKTTAEEKDVKSVVASKKAPRDQKQRDKSGTQQVENGEEKTIPVKSTESDKDGKEDNSQLELEF
jgi:topoisomerase-4 subunit A